MCWFVRFHCSLKGVSRIFDILFVFLHLFLRQMNLLLSLTKQSKLQLKIPVLCFSQPNFLLHHSFTFCSLSLSLWFWTCFGISWILGIQFTFVHPNAAIMQFFLEPYMRIKREYCFRLPLSPTQKLAWIDIEDVARVVANILGKNKIWIYKRERENGQSRSFLFFDLGCSRTKESEHYQHIYHLSGPEALSCVEIADLLTNETNKEIYYLETDPIQFREYIQQLRKYVWRSLFFPFILFCFCLSLSVSCSMIMHQIVRPEEAHSDGKPSFGWEHSFYQKKTKILCSFSTSWVVIRLRLLYLCLQRVTRKTRRKKRWTRHSLIKFKRNIQQVTPR